MFRMYKTLNSWKLKNIERTFFLIFLVVSQAIALPRMAMSQKEKLKTANKYL